MKKIKKINKKLQIDKGNKCKTILKARKKIFFKDQNMM